MELEGDDGSTFELKGDSSEAVFGRGSGFNTKDRTVSRRHILFQLDKTENHTEPRVSFQVIGMNPLWMRSGSGRDIKVFRKLERGEMAAGDWFCISGQSPVWFSLKRSEVGEETDLGSVNGSDRLDENWDNIDLSQIDLVKEFGFLVIGHEFDCYPKQRIRDVKNWDWFLNEPEEDSEDGGSFKSNRMQRKGNGRRKRKKGGGNDEDDDDWSGESEEDKQIVEKIRKIERSKRSTRSKEKRNPHEDTEIKKGSLQRNTVSSNGEDPEEGDEDEDDDGETCGRFLYRSPETTVRMANMLEILMRLKNVKNLDPRHSTLVENAYYLCKPPERSARVSKVRPPLYQYIRKLLFSDLDKSSIEHVLRQLRKLPWNECEAYLLKCFMKVHKGKYGQINLIASLTAGLSRYHDEFAVAVVDEVLEEIRLGLEINDYGMQQRRIAHMRFLGELYNYELVDSSVIFETLYLILVFGHDTPEQDVLDPPEDCFRIRMVITLLETCGHYFDRGSSKRKLDRFLIHFQRYVLSKGALPLDIEFDLQDLFAELRPSMTRHSSIDEVNSALIELEENERSGSSSTDKLNSEKHSDTEKPSSRHPSNALSANGENLVNGGEENGGIHEDIGDSDTDSGSGTLEQEGHDDDELDEENHDDGSETEDVDDDDDGGEPVSEEDDEVHVRQKVAEVDPVEAANFEQELRAVMQESMEQRRQELRGRPTLNMVIPMSVFEGSTRDHGRGVGGESGDEALDDETGGSKEVQVKVLVKRGNKQQTKQMYIPRDCTLVQSTKQKEAAEFEEKQDIKRLVLEYNDREEEENYGLGTQTLNWMPSGSNRVGSRGSMWEGSSGRGTGSRHRHQHQHQHHSGSGVYHGRRR